MPVLIGLSALAMAFSLMSCLQETIEKTDSSGKLLPEMVCEPCASAMTSGFAFHHCFFAADPHLSEFAEQPTAP